MNTQNTAATAPEWSYLISVDEIENGKARFKIEADEEARAALCKRLNLLSIEELSAQIDVIQKSGNARIHIKGKLVADVTQACVVSSDPVSDHIEESFEAWFADPDKALSFEKEKRNRQIQKGQSELKMLEEHEDPEDIVDGKINLGELVTQYLSLALNPYPHKEGALEESKYIQREEAFKERAENPFAKLKQWKEGLKEK